ncbi:hypothetical protein PF003_g5174 [Phytophthora fragariae]|nr:hypothetical protein PF003_g5174 [Phytophthora fragariae]
MSLVARHSASAPLAARSVHVAAAAPVADPRGCLAAQMIRRGFPKRAALV